jgi:hypothetical protein
MGGCDVYCALCGAFAATPFIDEGAEDEYTYDESRLAVNGMDWMAEVRILGQNPDSSSDQK